MRKHFDTDAYAVLLPHRVALRSYSAGAHRIEYSIIMSINPKHPPTPEPLSPQKTPQKPGEQQPTPHPGESLPHPSAVEAREEAPVQSPWMKTPKRGTALIFAASVVAFGSWILLSGMPVHAQDRLNSERCQSAQRELEAATSAVDADRKNDRGTENTAKLKIELERSRGVVASRCFDQPAGSALPGRASPSLSPAMTPPVIERPHPDLPPKTPPEPRAQMAPPPVQVARPTALTTCDPGGCWDSNGARLNGQGPVLIGPAGSCVAQGGFVNCR